MLEEVLMGDLKAKNKQIATWYFDAVHKGSKKEQD